MEALEELEVRTINDEKGVRAGVFLYLYYNQRNSERVATLFIIFALYKTKLVIKRVFLWMVYG